MNWKANYFNKFVLIQHPFNPINIWFPMEEIKSEVFDKREE